MMEVRTLPLSHIYPGEGRLRATQPERVADLAKSIGRLGLQTPLTVKRCTKIRDGVASDAWEIVTGHHRYEALRKLSRQEADCTVWCGEEAQARLWEISENLHRADLNVQERADHVAEWIKLTGEIVSSQVATKLSSRGRPNEGRPESGVNAAARELGITKDEAHRSVKIAGISPEARSAADEAGLNSQRDRLDISRMPDADAQVRRAREIADAKAAASKESRKADRDVVYTEAQRCAEWLKGILDLDETRRLAEWIVMMKPADLSAALLRDDGGPVFDHSRFAS